MKQNLHCVVPSFFGGGEGDSNAEGFLEQEIEIKDYAILHPIVSLLMHFSKQSLFVPHKPELHGPYPV